MSDDQDLLLPGYPEEFGSGVVGVCDLCGKRQAVIILQKERFKLCVLDFLNKTWEKPGGAKPGAPLPPYRSDRIWFDTGTSSTGQSTAILLTPTKVMRHPTVLITPDLYGITTTLLDAGIRFAREGFEVLIPDLGKAAGFGFPDHVVTRAGAYVGGGVPLNSARVRRLVRYFLDAQQFLSARPMADAEHTAVFGAGFGGSLAVALAGEEQRVTALALAYPRPVLPREFPRLVTAPVLFVDAGRDPASRRARAQFVAGADGGPVLEVADFPAARRNFLARDLGSYDLRRAEAAWQRILAFFRGRLIPTVPRPPMLPAKPGSTPVPVSAMSGAPAPAPTPPPAPG